MVGRLQKEEVRFIPEHHRVCHGIASLGIGDTFAQGLSEKREADGTQTVFSMLAVKNGGFAVWTHLSAVRKRLQGYPCIVHVSCSCKRQGCGSCRAVKEHGATGHTVADSHEAEIAVRQIRSDITVSPE